MKQRRSLVLSLLALGTLPAFAPALPLAGLLGPRLSGPTAVSVGAVANLGSPSPLYNASGSLITSSVAYLGATYRMDAWATAPPQQYNPVDSALSGPGTYFPTTITVRFSNSTWTSYGSATFAMNALNVRITTDRRGAITSATPFDWFKPVGPAGFGVSGGAYASSLAYSDVNPRTFAISDLSVDPTDATGCTGYARYLTVPGGATPGPGSPWDNTPSTCDPTSVVSFAWFFPRVNYPGAWNGNQSVPTWRLIAIE